LGNSSIWGGGNPKIKRGKAILFDKGIYGKFVYYDTLSKACEKICPLNIRMHEAIIKARKVLVEEGKELAENKEMIKNLMEGGNVFGEKD